MISVLHITPHLGGGVGKAVSGLISESVDLGLQVKHSVVTLEPLEKNHHAITLSSLNCPVYENISREKLFGLIERADIVQIEFWNHPLIPDLLVSSRLPAARIVFWCHISGLFSPVIPSGLIDCCKRFIFTSKCSRFAEENQSLNQANLSKIEVISSAGGVEVLRYEPKELNKKKLKFGYIGTLNFAKLHPDYIQYLSKVTIQNFKVQLFGDAGNQAKLENELNELGVPDLLEFNGYLNNLEAVLKDLDVLIYLLNPCHYGTAENALIEAMAMGVIPIVLGNPAELEIVQDRVNGLIISSPNDLDVVIKNLITDQSLRVKLSVAAAKSAREHFSFQDSAIKFDGVYRKVFLDNKRIYNFSKVFGNNPSDWFLAFQKNKYLFTSGKKIQADNRFARYLMLEKTKGSVFHFKKYFNSNKLLNRWANDIKRLELEDEI